jgi:hypothetical protein
MVSSGKDQIHFWLTNYLSHQPLMFSRIGHRIESVHGFNESGLQPLEPRGNDKPEYRFDWGRFHFSYGEIDGMDVVMCFVPYWSVILPLTLISAWCLLTKSRAKPATKQESADA